MPVTKVSIDGILNSAKYWSTNPHHVVIWDIGEPSPDKPNRAPQDVTSAESIKDDRICVDSFSSERWTICRSVFMDKSSNRLIVQTPNLPLNKTKYLILRSEPA